MENKNEISIITTTQNIEGYEILEYLGVLYCGTRSVSQYYTADECLVMSGYVVDSRMIKRTDTEAFIKNTVLMSDERIALIGLTVLDDLQYGTLVKVKKKPAV